MGRKSTYGLKPEILGHLLSIGAEGMHSPNAMFDEKTLEVRLRDRLTRALPGDSSLLEVLLGVVEGLSKDIQSLASKSLSEVLMEPKTDISLLEGIKEYGKKVSSTAASQVDIAIAITIYYAAIASSLVYHNKKISRHSYETLEQSFAELLELEWMSVELVELFSQARKISQEKKKV